MLGANTKKSLTAEDTSVGTTASEAPESVEQMLDSLVDSVCSRGFGMPAVFLLESMRPLNFVGSQCMHVLTPIASVLVESSKWEKLALALEDRETVDRLIRKIESREVQSSPKN